MNKYWTRKLSR